ncbi:MAG: 50S ribosomal protein L4 [Parachlamydiales bacterium]
MATLKKYSIDGRQLGDIKCNETLANAEAHGQMIKDYIVALRANARQWSANTKTRAEVNHTTKKPTAQKGTGGARHGNLVGPQFRGGGRVFGPKPKFDQHIRINKKERRAVIRALLADKIRENKIVVIENFSMDEPKTSSVVKFLKSLEMPRRTLFLAESTTHEIPTEDGSVKIHVHNDKHLNFSLSARNIPGVKFQVANTISGYDVAVAHTIVLTENALREIEEWLCA